MRKLIGCALTGLLGFVGANSAIAATAQCVNCDEMQMYNLARTLGAGSSAHIIWNPATGDVKRYRNYCGSGTNGTGSGSARLEGTKAGCNLQTEEQQVDADLALVAEAMSEVWRQTGGTFKADFTANIGGITYPSYYPGKPTAHDFLMDMGLRGDILRLVNTPEIFSTPGTGVPTTLGNALAAILAHGDAFLSMRQGVYVTIDVQFHDGSKISTLLTIGQNPSYVPNSGYDSSGHSLPDPNPGTPFYPGRWNFPPGDDHNLFEFIEYMRSLGVNITAGQVPNGQVNCVWTQSSNTTTCFIPR